MKNLFQTQGFLYQVQQSLTKGLLLVLLSTFSAAACDICGCAHGGSFFGIMPQTQFQFAGLRMSSKTFDSHLNSKLLKTQEVYKTAELWGRFYPFKNTQVYAFVPYKVNSQHVLSSNETLKKEGLGDVQVVVHYNLFNSLFNEEDDSKLIQNLLVGGGVSLPTGSYKTKDDIVENANFQLGTGAMAYMLSGVYSIKGKTIGLNSELAYRMSATNPEGYKFGNLFSTRISAFKQIAIKEVSIMPNIGLSLENSEKDKSDLDTITETGGYLLKNNLGVESYFSKMNLGFSYQLPVSQNLGNNELKFRNQLEIHFTKYF